MEFDYSNDTINSSIYSNIQEQEEIVKHKNKSSSYTYMTLGIFTTIWGLCLLFYYFEKYALIFVSFVMLVYFVQFLIEVNNSKSKD